jgi:DNA-binding NarL/FixJ family response regulator
MHEYDTGSVMKQIQILLVDDEPEVRRGLRMRFGLEADIRIVGEAADGATAVELAHQLSPQVVLMDVNLPVLDGIAATREIAARVPGAAVVILSLHDDQGTIDRALGAGAFAFVAKQHPDGDLLGAIRMAADTAKGVESRNTKHITKETAEQQAQAMAKAIEIQGE